MPEPIRVALHGFSDFERDTLRSVFRLAGRQRYRYVLVPALDGADWIVADGARPACVATIEAAARSADTLFVGAHAPAHCAARLARPIDTRQVLRELDDLVARRIAGGMAPALDVDALIVDDNAIPRAYLQRRLAELGRGAALAGDSTQALHCLSQRSFGHVFIDFGLGADSAMDGLALCRHIQRTHRHIDDRVPVLVMVSAHPGELDRVRSAFAGCDHYLAKPVLRETLRDVLKRSPGAVSARSQ